MSNYVDIFDNLMDITIMETTNTTSTMGTAGDLFTTGSVVFRHVNKRQDLDGIFSDIHHHLQGCVESFIDIDGAETKKEVEGCKEFNGLVVNDDINKFQKIIKCSCGKKQWIVNLNIAEDFNSYDDFQQFFYEEVRRIDKLYIKEPTTKPDDFRSAIEDLEV